MRTASLAESGVGQEPSGVSKGEFSRRRFLAGLAITAGGVLSAGSPVPPPKESGLSSEGLLAGLPGFQPRTVAPLPHQELPGFLSRAQLAAHHAEYVRALENLKAAEAGLATAGRSPAESSTYAALRHQQVAAANDVLLHEFYFRNLAPQKMDLPSYAERHLREHQGSLQSWATDFVACGLVAQAWVALVYDPYDDRWHNTVMDSDVDGVWVGANPLVVCDVAAHAYAQDYRRREDYVAAFVDHIDWNEVARRYRRVDRM